MLELTEKEKVTLAFLKEMADQATEDLALANTLTRKGGAFGYYFINVAKLKTLTPEQYARQFPQYMSEAELLRKEYGRAVTADEDHARINKIEEGLQTFKAELMAEIKTLIAESLKESAVTPDKQVKKNKKTVQQETENAEGDEADAESEA